MNVLAIGAHFDDIELGCSGTLINHVKRGDNVTALFITDSAYRDPKGNLIRESDVALREGKAAVKVIGADFLCLNYKTLNVPYDDELTSKILDYIEDLKIDTLYSHWTGDIHRDHHYAAKNTIMAGRHVPRVLMYRSNFYDSEHTFRGNFYSDISDSMEQKREVIKAHKSELERVRYTWLEFFENQNSNDGQKIGVNFAECFEVIRYMI